MWSLFIPLHKLEDITAFMTNSCQVPFSFKLHLTVTLECSRSILDEISRERTTLYCWAPDGSCANFCCVKHNMLSHKQIVYSPAMFLFALLRDSISNFKRMSFLWCLRRHVFSWHFSKQKNSVPGWAMVRPTSTMTWSRRASRGTSFSLLWFWRSAKTQTLRKSSRPELEVKLLHWTL